MSQSSLILGQSKPSLKLNLTCVRTHTLFCSSFSEPCSTESYVTFVYHHFSGRKLLKWSARLVGLVRTANIARKQRAAIAVTPTPPGIADALSATQAKAASIVMTKIAKDMVKWMLLESACATPFGLVLTVKTASPVDNS